MVALGISNLCFMLPWQFAQFVLLTQVNTGQGREIERECGNKGDMAGEIRGRIEAWREQRTLWQGRKERVQMLAKKGRGRKD